MLEAVAEHGVHITFVATPEPGNGARREITGFAYTVGLWQTFEQPELCVFGLGPEDVQELFDAITEDCEDGKRFHGGQKVDGLMVDYAVRLLEVPWEQAAKHCEGIVWAYEDQPVPVVQLVWPDKNRRWPWEDGVRDGFREAQPLLGQPPK